VGWLAGGTAGVVTFVILPVPAGRGSQGPARRRLGTRAETQVKTGQQPGTTSRGVAQMARHGRRLPRRPDDTLAGLARADGSDVADLLREVAEFRLALATDLTIAAAAADVESEAYRTVPAAGLASALVASQQVELRHLEDRVLTRLGSGPRDRVDGERGAARRGRRARGLALHSAPLLVAASLVGLVSGFVVPQLSGGPSSMARVSVSAQGALDDLARAVAGQDPAAALGAGATLHSDVRWLVGQAPGDRAAAHAAARLLLGEGLFLGQLAGPAAAQLQTGRQALVATLTAAVGEPLSQIAGPDGGAPTSNDDATAAALSAGSSAPSSNLLPPFAGLTASPAPPPLAAPRLGLPGTSGTGTLGATLPSGGSLERRLAPLPTADGGPSAVAQQPTGGQQGASPPAGPGQARSSATPRVVSRPLPAASASPTASAVLRDPAAVPTLASTPAPSAQTADRGGSELPAPASALLPTPTLTP